MSTSATSSHGTPPIIVARGLKHTYRKSKKVRIEALQGIDLNVRQGEILGLVGPDGAGKSTLLHILGMHDQSWSGEYFFDETAVHKLDGKKRAALRNSNIGFVFQSYHLLDDQTVFENLELRALSLPIRESFWQMSPQGISIQRRVRRLWICSSG